MTWEHTVRLPSEENYTVRNLFCKDGENTKLEKSDKAEAGYMSIGLMLAPANLSGYEMCRGRSKGCTAACLNTAGRGQVQTAQKARIAKTILLNQQPDVFVARILHELKNAQKRAEKSGNKLAVRLNVTSDYPWEERHPEIFKENPHVQFYDYTKILGRAEMYTCTQDWPKNYHLTFSRSETNDRYIQHLWNTKINFTVVFANDNLPKKWNGRDVINGDANDLRFLDPQGVIVGLKAKGKAKKDNTGFVLSLPMVK